ncbi:transketolase [Fulvitalea axinellae]|uniref:Transketolase n=1 Tax=Fulvitalea axinellae TaxID=1182444 RepID=A0AAU9CXD0_9BACT|nr:transketolase [Fulvitalea axinellae]
MLYDVPTQMTIKKNSLAKDEVLNDYRVACLSREVSLQGRKEVFMGKAKFGIFGDGKELAQIAMARAFQPGDWRSGYYRDQTLMFAMEELTPREFFAQLYAHTDIEAEPASGGRMMNCHFGSRLLDENGEWVKQTDKKLTGSDVSSTGGQMARVIGLGYASKYYRENPDVADMTDFSVNGDEVVFSTIGNASTSEGVFLETVNAAGVMGLPVVMSVWDDGYGISVPNSYHTVKESISEALKGFGKEGDSNGVKIFVVKGWDYEALCETYAEAADWARKYHVPSLVHVIEMTQPQGHSSSGSHERYKSEERLTWEDEYDCVAKLKEYILDRNLADEATLETIEKEAKVSVRNQKNSAWKAYRESVDADKNQGLALVKALAQASKLQPDLVSLISEFEKSPTPIKSDVVRMAKKALRLTRTEKTEQRESLRAWLSSAMEKYEREYSSHLHSESDFSALKVEEVKPIFDEDAPLVDGFSVINTCFDKAFEREPRLFAFGEDVGKIGDVNQGMAGLQEKYGELRVHDTSIREMTIIGEGTGAALRGLRPIAEVQYLDYLVYALNTLTDDVACTHYRTRGGQKVPLIVRTRGHRLEGVWHSGSPMSMILGSLRGMHVLVPRNLTQASGFYNTLLKGDDPALVIECLNAYRQKEKMPVNLGEFTLPLGVPEVLREGADITTVTYGAMCRIVMESARQLAEVGISCEVIDVQSLLPFDVHHSIVESIKKTNRVIFADEDVPGGASAFMMQQVVDGQGAYAYLDSKPVCISAKAHRPAYSSDGDYFSKPNSEDVFDVAYEMMRETDPNRFAELY